MQKIRERWEKRKEIEQDIELHDQCLMWLETIDLKRKTTTKEKKIMEVKSEMEKHQKVVDEKKQQIELIKQQEKALNAANQDLRAKVKESEKKMATSPVQSLENEINRTTEEITRAKTKASNTKKRLIEMKSELKNKRSHLQELDADKTNKEYAAEENKRIKLEGSIDDYKANIRDKEQKLKMYDEKIQQFKEKLNDKNTDEAKKMNMLKKRNEVELYFLLLFLSVNRRFYKFESCCCRDFVRMNCPRCCISGTYF